MTDPLWHQAVRQENYEPLDPDEAAAVHTAAAAILERTSPGGSASLSDHRASFAAIGFQIGIRGWERDPDTARDEIGGMSILQLHPVMQRAISSGVKYLRAMTPAPKKADNSSKSLDSEALQRIRDRLNKRKDD